MSDLSYRPVAREGLMVVEMGDESLVFNRETNEAHSLNAIAAAVWRHCDGEHDCNALRVACGVDEETLDAALDLLRSTHLLEEPENGELLEETEDGERVSRRRMLRRTALAGAGLGVAIPVIRSVIAPTPAFAGSVALGGTCANDASCDPGLCCGSVAGVCLMSILSPGTVGSGGLCVCNQDCSSGTCNGGTCT